jgi:hypothetical protein
MSRANSGYQVVYSAALKALETDPYQEVVFSVATSHSACSSLAPEEDGGAIPSLHLYLWNETLVRFSAFVYFTCKNCSFLSITLFNSFKQSQNALDANNKI